MGYCFHCGYKFPEDHIPGREDLCPKCSSAVHCCLNCEFYDETAHNKCREPASEWVADREGANFCSFFKLRKGTGEKGADKKRKKELKDKWDKLFGESKGK
jgi:hypothetical protein